ncbi:MAG: hypothetical protein ROZ64_14945 [Burkholderiaceae bacterium]|nr:hypothetical protein [Burkholderiaceae bacterium]
MKSVDEEHRILDVRQATHVTDYERPWAAVVGGRAASLAFFGRRARTEDFGVDAIADRVQSSAGHAYAIAQIREGGRRQRNLCMHEMPQKPARSPQRSVAADEVVHLPAVFAMHAHGDSGEQGGDLRFERADVARVHDRRAQPAKCTPQLRERQGERSGPKPQGLDSHLRIRDACSDSTAIGEGNDRVPEPVRREPVHQVDHAVLHPSGVEAMDDVNQVCCSCLHCRTGACTTTRMAG